MPLFLHQYFEFTARHVPERIAVDVPPSDERRERIQVTYAELARQSATLAHALRDSVRGECVVGILLPRNSALLYAAQLAVLQSGAAYTCLDPMFPDERIREVLADADAVAVLTDAAGVSRLQAVAASFPHVVDVRCALAEFTELPASPPPPPWLCASSMAYVIYTSGSTGRPKGVMIEHHSIVNLVAGDLAEFQLSESDRVAQGSSAAYDSSVEETWLAFAAGATLVVMDDETIRLGPDLVTWLRDERISVFCPPPTLLRATGCENPASALPELKLLYVGGEALPRDVVERWAPGRRLVNGYGPTECTVTSLRGDIVAGGVIHIGKAVPGLEARVLDEALQEVPCGEKGELCLGGGGLARGYWKSPELTGAKFINHPLGRLYRTGDLVHCDEDGNFHYHGRMDAQVKLRGYRMELGEIEARLAGCDGVRAAACRVQEDAGSPILVGFIVPENPENPPATADLVAALAAALPSYMVPVRWGFLAELPTTIGGKLDRQKLPHLDEAKHTTNREKVAPENHLEMLIEAAFRQCLKLEEPVSTQDDFFFHLGGDSLSAAILVTILRNEPTTAWVTVRDIYQSPTVAQLAKLAPAMELTEKTPIRMEKNRQALNHFAVTLAQALWLLAEFSVASWLSYLAIFGVLPDAVNAMGVVPSLLLAPVFFLAAIILSTPIMIIYAVVMKRLLIGRYQPLRVPVWSGFYLRHWIVKRAVSRIPWSWLSGTVFQQIALRALGAKIGKRVHIHRGVNFMDGGWDLLEIGDDVTLSQDSAVRLVELDDGDIVVAPVSLGDGATLDIRASMSGNTEIERGGYLTALSSLVAGSSIPASEKWDGIPASSAGIAPDAPELTKNAAILSEAKHGWLMVAARCGLLLLLALPSELMALMSCFFGDISSKDLSKWLSEPWVDGQSLVVMLCLLVIAVPLTLLWQAAIMRLLGRVPEGNIHRWSMAYIRVWLKAGLLESAGNWLTGTLIWPMWLRAAGMRVGAGCEISTITDVIPEHLEIGAETFFADGIYLGGPRIQHGIVTLAKTSLGTNTFLGNHVVIHAGQCLPSDILLGICTVADDKKFVTGTSWFGLPPFELPRREVVELDRSLTHNPSTIRYCNRLFWELLRFALPIVPALVSIGWYFGMAKVASSPLPVEGMAVAIPTVSFAAISLLCLIVLVMKWLLLGRVKPGQHALWSCWCSRWDFLYVAWGQYASAALQNLEGTLMLGWYLRAIGVKLGKRVVLGSGFSHVVDPDMIHIEDDATVNASYQAHTFEDRVLKIDHVYVRSGATLGAHTVPLYGADIGEVTHVAAHSVIMKRERLLPGRRYEGAPTR